MATLGEARKAAGTDAAAVVAYASLVYGVALTPGMPAESLRPVLADALTSITRALATDGSNVKLLEHKGVLLRFSSQVEPDATRKKAFDEEWLRTIEKLDGLEK